ncbi:MAG: cysteine peptidase family C39 domain-containing protein, partial [Candidatus Omnitrophota bacterium]
MVVAIFLPEQASWAMGYDPSVIWAPRYYLGSGQAGYMANFVAENVRRSLATLEDKPLGEVQIAPELVVDVRGTTQQSVYLSRAYIKKIYDWLRDPSAQVDNYCGVYALQNLLNAHNIDITLEELALRVILVDLLSGNIKELRGQLKTSLYALNAVANSLGVKTSPVKAGLDYPVPFIAHVSSDHFIYITRIAENDVYYQEKDKEEITTKDEFLAKFSGYALSADNDGYATALRAEVTRNIRGGYTYQSMYERQKIKLGPDPGWSNPFKKIGWEYNNAHSYRTPLGDLRFTTGDIMDLGTGLMPIPPIFAALKLAKLGKVAKLLNLSDDLGKAVKGGSEAAETAVKLSRLAKVGMVIRPLAMRSLYNGLVFSGVDLAMAQANSAATRGKGLHGWEILNVLYSGTPGEDDKFIANPFKGGIPGGFMGGVVFGVALSGAGYAAKGLSRGLKNNMALKKAGNSAIGKSISNGFARVGNRIPVKARPYLIEGAKWAAIGGTINIARGYMNNNARGIPYSFKQGAIDFGVGAGLGFGGGATRGFILKIPKVGSTLSRFTIMGGAIGVTGGYLTPIATDGTYKLPLTTSELRPNLAQNVLNFGAGAVVGGMLRNYAGKKWITSIAKKSRSLTGVDKAGDFAQVRFFHNPKWTYMVGNPNARLAMASLEGASSFAMIMPAWSAIDTTVHTIGRATGGSGWHWQDTAKERGFLVEGQHVALTMLSHITSGAHTGLMLGPGIKLVAPPLGVYNGKLNPTRLAKPENYQALSRFQKSFVSIAANPRFSNVVKNILKGPPKELVAADAPAGISGAAAQDIFGTVVKQGHLQAAKGFVKGVVGEADRLAFIISALDTVESGSEFILKRAYPDANKTAIKEMASQAGFAALFFMPSFVPMSRQTKLAKSADVAYEKAIEALVEGRYARAETLLRRAEKLNAMPENNFRIAAARGEMGMTAKDIDAARMKAIERGDMVLAHSMNMQLGWTSIRDGRVRDGLRLLGETANYYRKQAIKARFQGQAQQGRYLDLVKDTLLNTAIEAKGREATTLGDYNVAERQYRLLARRNPTQANELKFIFAHSKRILKEQIAVDSAKDEMQKVLIQEKRDLRYKGAEYKEYKSNARLDSKNLERSVDNPDNNPNVARAFEATEKLARVVSSLREKGVKQVNAAELERELKKLGIKGELNIEYSVKLVNSQLEAGAIAAKEGRIWDVDKYSLAPHLLLREAIEKHISTGEPLRKILGDPCGSGKSTQAHILFRDMVKENPNTAFIFSASEQEYIDRVAQDPVIKKSGLTINRLESKVAEDGILTTEINQPKKGQINITSTTGLTQLANEGKLRDCIIFTDEPQVGLQAPVLVMGGPKGSWFKLVEAQRIGLDGNGTFTPGVRAQYEQARRQDALLLDIARKLVKQKGIGIIVSQKGPKGAEVRDRFSFSESAVKEIIKEYETQIESIVPKGANGKSVLKPVNYNKEVLRDLLDGAAFVLKASEGQHFKIFVDKNSGVMYAYETRDANRGKALPNTIFSDPARHSGSGYWGRNAIPRMIAVEYSKGASENDVSIWFDGLQSKTHKSVSYTDALNQARGWIGFTGTPQGFKPSFKLLNADLIQLRSEQNTIETHADIIVTADRVAKTINEIKAAVKRGDRVVAVSCNDALELAVVYKMLAKELGPEGASYAVKAVADMDPGRLNQIGETGLDAIRVKDYKQLESLAVKGKHIFLCHGLYDAANIAVKGMEGGRATVILNNITSMVNAVQFSQRIGTTHEAAMLDNPKRGRMQGKVVYIVDYNDPRLLTEDVVRLKNAGSTEKARKMVLDISNKILVESNSHNIANLARSSVKADIRGAIESLKELNRDLGIGAQREAVNRAAHPYSIYNEGVKLSQEGKYKEAMGVFANSARAFSRQGVEARNNANIESADNLRSMAREAMDQARRARSQYTLSINDFKSAERQLMDLGYEKRTAEDEYNLGIAQKAQGKLIESTKSFDISRQKAAGKDNLDLAYEANTQMAFNLAAQGKSDQAVRLSELEGKKFNVGEREVELKRNNGFLGIVDNRGEVLAELKVNQEGRLQLVGLDGIRGDTLKEIGESLAVVAQGKEVKIGQAQAAAQPEQPHQAKAADSSEAKDDTSTILYSDPFFIQAIWIP